MKESAQILALIMAIVFGFAAIANTDKNLDERVQLVPCEVGIFKLVYLKKSSEKVNVAVLNENGTEIKSESVYASQGFLNIYDLNEFGTGEYTFRVQDSTGQVDHTVYFNKDMNIALCQMGETGKYKLVAEDLDVDEALRIYILNADDDLLMNDEISGEGSVSKVFDLSKITDPGEEISFMIKEQNRLLKIATF